MAGARPLWFKVAMTTRNTIARLFNRWMGKPAPVPDEPVPDPSPAPDAEPETPAEPEPDLWLRHQEPWPGEPFPEPSLLHSAEPEAAEEPELVRWAPEPEAAEPPLQQDPSPVAAPARKPAPIALSLVAHIEGVGDVAGAEDGWVGRASGPGRIEGFTVGSEAPGWQTHVSCQSVLQDGSLGPVVPAGQYCGTQGRALPLYGFILHVSAAAPQFAELTYEAVFDDGTRSERLAPGAICASPAHAALVAMRIFAGAASETGPQGWAGADVAPVPASTMPGAPVPPISPSVLDIDWSIDELWATDPPQTRLAAHVAFVGDMEQGADGWVGKPADNRAVEGFSFSSALPGWDRHVSYQSVLHSNTMGDIVAGGAYCGTLGKMLPIHGFVLHVADEAPQLAGMIYEGIFEDGFKSGPLRPGTVCASPGKTPLIGLRITLPASSPAAKSEPAADESAAEPVRLVIWDLDETFWGGTLTEGGITWREENADIVRALARRGIPSSICSKNEPEHVFAILDQHGMRDYFVFPSISWEPKGPRLASMVTALQLRAPTLLFIDDNPMNRAEALSFVPGLQVGDETVVPALLDSPLLQGKPDPDMKRLAQYRLLEQRQTDQARSGGDTTAFLRESGIIVSIEHDLAPHIDRAIELINRTNQLNFTKNRLKEDPDDPEVARAELRALLAQFDVQAGILRVRDAYGDYGYCGLYVTRRESSGVPELLHFAFSCRILGMGIETWLYRRLKRPRLRVVGTVLTDVFAEGPDIDWIGMELPGVSATPAARQKMPLSYVLLRGACDMRALSHYFTMIADRVIEEFDSARLGQTPLINASLIASQAMHGLDPRAIADSAPLGFIPEDFETILAKDPPPGPAAWLLGFTIERPVAIYRHKATGMLLPASVIALDISPEAMMRGAPNQADPAVIAHLREKFEYFGRRPDERIDDMFRDSLRQIFSRAGSDVGVFVLLGNARIINGDGSEGTSEGFRHHNAIIAEIAADFPNVELLSPLSFMTQAEMLALHSPHHFDRIVYFRIFRHIANRLGAQVAGD